MKSIYLFIIPMMLVGFSFNCQAQTVQSDSEKSSVGSEIIEVYYFHNTRRCATCQAVESVTKTTLEETYSDQMDKGTITFQSLDLEDDVNEPLARKLNVSGQTLLFVKNNKKKDITNDAFLYARTKPEKFQEKIILTVESF